MTIKKQIEDVFTLERCNSATLAFACAGPMDCKAEKNFGFNIWQVKKRHDITRTGHGDKNA